MAGISTKALEKRSIEVSRECDMQLTDLKDECFNKLQDLRHEWVDAVYVPYRKFLTTLTERMLAEDGLVSVNERERLFQEFFPGDITDAVTLDEDMVMFEDWVDTFHGDYSYIKGVADGEQIPSEIRTRKRDAEKNLRILRVLESALISTSDAAGLGLVVDL